MVDGRQVVSDEDGGPCLLRYYPKGIDLLGADDEQLVTLGLRQLDRLRIGRGGTYDSKSPFCTRSKSSIRYCCGEA